jgi:hypothetical protein
MELKASKKVMTISIIVVIILVFSGVIIGASSFGEDDKKKSDDKETVPVEDAVDTLDTITGSTEEGQTSTMPLDFGDLMLKKVTITLSWSDDMQGSEPDKFGLVLNSPDDKMSTEGSDGELTVTIELEESPCCSSHGSGGGGGCGSEKTNADTTSSSDDGSGGWSFEVSAINAGDDPIGPFGLFVQKDTGNSWSLDVEYTYCPLCGGEVGDNSGGGGCH